MNFERFAAEYMIQNSINEYYSQNKGNLLAFTYFAVSCKVWKMIRFDLGKSALVQLIFREICAMAPMEA